MDNICLIKRHLFKDLKDKILRLYCCFYLVIFFISKLLYCIDLFELFGNSLVLFHQFGDFFKLTGSHMVLSKQTQVTISQNQKLFLIEYFKIFSQWQMSKPIKIWLWRVRICFIIFLWHFPPPLSNWNKLEVANFTRETHMAGSWRSWTSRSGN